MAEFQITDMEKLTIKCAHLEHELTVTRAQQAVDQAAKAREDAVRAVMSQYIENPDDFEKYTVNLDNNLIVEREVAERQQAAAQQMPQQQRLAPATGGNSMRRV